MSLSRLHARFSAIFAVCVLTFPQLANAQAARLSPRLSTVLPSGGTIGAEVEVTVSGFEIDNADGLWFSDANLTVSPVAGKAKTFKISIGKAAKPGDVDVRALAKDGISNPRTFTLSRFPEISETEPNNEPGQAKNIAVNSVVNGVVTQTDVDWFSFTGKRGQRVIVSLAAQRIESKLDGTLRLYNSRGVELAESRDADGTDAQIDIKLPTDDVYKIKLHDMTYSGSTEHFYRLTLHDGPVIDAIFPAIAQAGVEKTFTIFGRNLGKDAKIVAGLESITKTLKPEFISAEFLPAPLYGTAVALRGQAITHEGSNSFVISESDDPVVEEREPNDLDKPQVVAPPVAIAGDFRPERDLDVYRFTAKKGEVWVIEAIAQGIGSNADTTFTLQKVPATGEPTDLNLADDTDDSGLSPRLNLASTDASLKWTVPDDGTYQVLLNDVAGGSRGGPKLFYRLSIRRERPGFRLFLAPTAPNALDSIALRRGGRTTATVMAWRLDGFTGPIWVTPIKLPAGVNADPVIIPALAKQTPIVFDTGANAALSVDVIRLGGTAISAIQSNEPVALPSPGFQGVAPRGESVPISPIWPAVKLPNSQRTPTSTVRATHGFAVAIRESSPFLLTAKPLTKAVVAGSSLPIDLTLARMPGCDDAITLAAADLPPFLTPPTGSFTKGVNTLHIEWPIANNVAPRVYSLVIRGTGTFKPDPKGPAFKVDEPSNPILIAVRPSPVTLTQVSKPLMLKPGESQVIELKLDRQNGFTGPIKLRLVSPATSKLTTPELTVIAKDAAAKLTISAARDAPPGAISSTIRAVAEVAGESLEVILALPITIAKP